MAPHSSTLAWKIPRMEEPGGLQSTGSLRVGHNWATSFSLSCIGEGNGNPLHCSCLESPRDGGAWWAAVYGVTQSRTQLKQLSSSSSSSNIDEIERILSGEVADFSIQHPAFYPKRALYSELTSPVEPRTTSEEKNSELNFGVRIAPRERVSGWSTL